MAKFALLLNHRPDRYDGLAPDDLMAIIKDYIAWVEEKVGEGIYAGGHKLDTEAGKLLASNGSGVEVHDIPSTEVAEVLGGIMVIEVDDMAAAVEIGRAHPHFLHNERMEIWPLDESVE